ncbi:Genetic competence transcription factor [Anoxybacillus thermarum]|uniref:Genetic competence transcription factor n=1 Tax=Anoxybacillus thermarum TaxID=404937 RepID=A0A0D0Q6I2_9BACL|nr:competence protein ComK [Anoxybacillus thermarum]KIQ93563.1 Genetic competence transcription factor [Anoxybacillus thermarum]
MERMEEYIIMEETAALVPQYDEYGRLGTIVYELYDTYKVDQSPKQIMQQSCRYYGSTYEGKVQAAKHILGIRQMAPVSVCEALRLYFFPTCSPDSDRCVWIAQSHIKTIQPHGKKKTKVVLKNNKQLIVDIQKGTMEGKMYKTAMLIFILQQRILNNYEK